MSTEAIYLDATVLISRRGLKDLQVETSAWEIGLYAPEVAIKEFIEGRLRQAKKSWDSIVTSVSDLNQLCGSETVGFSELTDHKAKVDQQAEAFLQSLEIEAIPTSLRIDLTDLIERAIRREIPFKENDRGFRDAVILDTIMWHMKEMQFKKAILLTEDKDFSHKASLRLQQQGLTLCILNNVGDVLTKLNQERDENFEKEKERKECAIVEYLNAHFSEVAEFVKHKTDINEGELTGRGLFGFGFGQKENALPAGVSVQEIQDCRPMHLGKVTYLPGASSQTEHEIVDAAWIEVVTEFDLVLSGYVTDPFPWFTRKFSPSAEGGYAPAPEPTGPTEYKGEKTVTRPIQLRAELTSNCSNPMDYKLSLSEDLFGS